METCHDWALGRMIEGSVFEGYLGSTAEICFSTILPQPLRQTYTRTFSMPVSGSIEGSCFAVSTLQGFTLR